MMWSVCVVRVFGQCVWLCVWSVCVVPRLQVRINISKFGWFTQRVFTISHIVITFSQVLYSIMLNSNSFAVTLCNSTVPAIFFCQVTPCLCSAGTVIMCPTCQGSVDNAVDGNGIHLCVHVCHFLIDLLSFSAYWYSVDSDYVTYLLETTMKMLQWDKEAANDMHAWHCLIEL